MKRQRQNAILDIIAKQAVETQDELLECLTEQGFPATQATVSRDIRELGLVKTLDQAGMYRYARRDEAEVGTFSPRLRTIFCETVVSVDYARNLAVIKTMPGMASAACAALDAMRNGNIIGTLAGDDTAFIVLRDDEATKAFVEKIHAQLR